MFIAPSPIPISHVAVEPPRPAQQQTPQETARPVVGPDQIEAISAEERRRKGGAGDAQNEAARADDGASQAAADPATQRAGTPAGEVGQLLDLFV